MTIPITDAVALLLPLLMLCDVFSVWHYRGTFHRRSVKLLLPGSIIGVAIGTLFFGYFIENQRVLEVGLGVVTLLFVGFRLASHRWTPALQGRHPKAAEGVFMGMVSGFASTLAHAGGPPTTIYLLPLRMARDLFVGTTVIFFAGLNWIKLAAFIFLGLLNPTNLTAVAILAPLTLLSVRLGIILNRHFTDVWFNRIVYTVLVVTGIRLLYS
jgi:uncharacterized membrane protein YfcA